MRFHFYGFGGKMFDPPKRRKKHSRSAAKRAFRGRKVTFHGAFKSKEDAMKKERETPGSYIRHVRGRYRVETRNE
jgi:predicted GIY-YIG superfamily endonuclease